MSNKRRIGTLGRIAAMCAVLVMTLVTMVVSRPMGVLAENGVEPVAVGDNSWQIVDEGGENSDSYVRVSKTITQTGEENLFNVHLRIDKKPDAIDEFFAGFLTAVNSDQGVGVGGTAKWNGTDTSSGLTWFQIQVYSSENEFDGQPSESRVISAAALSGDIKTLLMMPEGSVKGDYGLVLWTGGNQAGSYGGNGTEADPYIVKVSTSWEGFEELFGTTTTSVRLDNVTDPMGECIEYVAGSAQTNNGAVSGENDLTWNIGDESEGIERDGWMVGVAELDYRIRLVNFETGGFPTEDAVKTYATNGTTTLEYTVNTSSSTGAGSGEPGSIEFKIPVVRGLLYDLVAQKTDDAEKALSGATFNVYKDGVSEPVQTVTTGEDGQIVFKNLLWGTYTVKEISAPEGYELATDEWNVTLCYTTNPADVVNSTVEPNNAMAVKSSAFVNPLQSITVPLTLNEVKTVKNGSADAGDFSFTVTAGSQEAAELAGLDKLTGGTYDSDSLTYTFTNGVELQADIQQEVRHANGITFSADNVGEIYTYTYAEVKGNDPSYVYDTTQWKIEFIVGRTAGDTGQLMVTYNLYKGNSAEPEQTGTFTPSNMTEKTATVSFTNTFVPLGLNVKKVVKNADGTESPLKGAKFVLTEAADSQAPASDIFTDSAMETALAGALEVGDDSTVKFYNLQPGKTYYIVETYAPAGYQISGPYKIVVDQDGNGATFYRDINDETGTHIVAADRMLSLAFEDALAPVIPSTGGIGNLPLYVAGTVTVAGSIVVARRPRNER